MPVKFGNKCKNSENITGKINTKYKNARKKVKYWKSCRGQRKKGLPEGECKTASFTQKSSLDKALH